MAAPAGRNTAIRSVAGGENSTNEPDGPGALVWVELVLDHLDQVVPVRYGARFGLRLIAPGSWP